MSQKYIHPSKPIFNCCNPSRNVWHYSSTNQIISPPILSQINLAQVAVAGLPYSGKSTLLQSMLALKPEHHKEMELSNNKVPGLSIYEVALMINPYWEEERCQWLPKVTKQNVETLMFAGSLAQICARRKLSLSLLSETNSGDVDIDPLFKSPLINDHFDKRMAILRISS